MTQDKCAEIRSWWKVYFETIIGDKDNIVQMSHAQRLALQVPFLLDALEAATKRADKAEEAFRNCTSCNLTIKSESDRDRWKAQYEALKQAIPYECEFCMFENDENAVCCDADNERGGSMKHGSVAKGAAAKMENDRAIEVLKAVQVCETHRPRHCDTCQYTDSCLTNNEGKQAFELAIAALERQRKEPCEYCDETYYVKRMRVLKPVMAPLTREQEHEQALSYQLVECENPFCPMCGRKLEVRNESNY